MWQRSWIGVAVLAVAAVPAQGQVKLEWKLKQGDKFYVENVATKKQAIDVGGQPLPVNVKTTKLMSFEVLKKDADGAVVLRHVIEDVRTEGDGPVASRQKDINEKTKGATFTLTLDKSGRITKMQGMEDFFKRFTGDNPALAQVLKSVVNDNTLKETFQDLFAFVPDKPVTRGDSWKRDMAMSLGPLGRFKISHQYTYEGPGKDGEQIVVQSTFAFEPSKDDGGLPFKITSGDIKVESAKGVIVFDPKRGRVVRQDMTANIKGSLTVSVDGQNTILALLFDQDVKIRVLDKKP